MKIIYIQGAGHSGSTIVDIILGNNIQTVSGGELTNSFKDAFVLKRRCSCSSLGENCPYWNEIKEKWENRSQSTVHEYIRQIKKYETNKLYSWFRAVVIFNFVKSDDFKEYLKNTEILYRVIADYNNKSVVIDSSKRNLRAFYLHKYIEIECVFLHLIRSCCSAIYVFGKKEKVETKKFIKYFYYSFRWLVVNKQAAVLSSFYGNTIQIQYEEFLQEPEKWLKNIYDIKGIDMREAMSKIEKNDYFQINHIVSGSYLKRKGEIKIWSKPKLTAEKNLPPLIVKLCKLFQKIILD